MDIDGVISKNKIDEIKKYENVLNIFFTQAYADIKSGSNHVKKLKLCGIRR